jgi:hypothetical protein
MFLYFRNNIKSKLEAITSSPSYVSSIFNTYPALNWMNNFPPSPHRLNPTRIIKRKIFTRKAAPLIWFLLSALSELNEKRQRTRNTLGGACNCYENQNISRWGLNNGEVIEVSNSSAGIPDSGVKGEGRLDQGVGSSDGWMAEVGEGRDGALPTLCRH